MVVENFANNVFGHISKILKSNENLAVSFCYMLFLEGVCFIIKKVSYMNTYRLIMGLSRVKLILFLERLFGKTI